MSAQTALPTSSPDSARLDRLLGYLEQDRTNEQLRGDVFDEALRVGALDVAQRLADEAGAEGGPAWQHRRAMLALRCGDYATARALLLELVAAGEAHPAVRYNAAYAALRAGEYAVAEHEAAGLLDSIPEAMELLLSALHHQRRVDEAIDLFRQRGGAAAATNGAIGVASLVAVDASAFVDAENWAQQALAVNDRQLDALTAMGSMLLGQQRNGQARACLERALAIAPHDGRVLSAMGMCELSEMQLEAARHYFTLAIRALPLHVGTWHGLGWCCIAQHDFATAAHAFDAAIAVDRNFGESHGGAAIVHALRGNVAEAREAARRAQGLDPKGLSAAYALALLDGKITADMAAFEQFASGVLEGRTDISGKIRLIDIVARHLRPPQG
ncbi:MAG: tetratricopeptide repeat protein [Rhodocyclaceae bacterium]